MIFFTVGINVCVSEKMHIKLRVLCIFSNDFRVISNFENSARPAVRSMTAFENLLGVFNVIKLEAFVVGPQISILFWCKKIFLLPYGFVSAVNYAYDVGALGNTQ